MSQKVIAKKQTDNLIPYTENDAKVMDLIIEQINQDGYEIPEQTRSKFKSLQDITHKVVFHNSDNKVSQLDEEKSRAFKFVLLQAISKNTVNPINAVLAVSQTQEQRFAQYFKALDNMSYYYVQTCETMEIMNEADNVKEVSYFMLINSTSKSEKGEMINHDFITFKIAYQGEKPIAYSEASLFKTQLRKVAVYSIVENGEAVDMKCFMYKSFDIMSKTDENGNVVPKQGEFVLNNSKATYASFTNVFGTDETLIKDFTPEGLKTVSDNLTNIFNVGLRDSDFTDKSLKNIYHLDSQNVANSPCDFIPNLDGSNITYLNENISIPFSSLTGTNMSIYHDISGELIFYTQSSIFVGFDKLKGRKIKNHENEKDLYYIITTAFKNINLKKMIPEECSVSLRIHVKERERYADFIDHNNYKDAKIIVGINMFRSKDGRFFTINNKMDFGFPKGDVMALFTVSCGVQKPEFISYMNRKSIPQQFDVYYTENVGAIKVGIMTRYINFAEHFISSICYDSGWDPSCSHKMLFITMAIMRGMDFNLERFDVQPNVEMFPFFRNQIFTPSGEYLEKCKKLSIIYQIFISTLSERNKVKFINFIGSYFRFIFMMTYYVVMVGHSDRLVLMERFVKFVEKLNTPEGITHRKNRRAIKGKHVVINEKEIIVSQGQMKTIIDAVKAHTKTISDVINKNFSSNDKKLAKIKDLNQYRVFNESLDYMSINPFLLFDSKILTKFLKLISSELAKDELNKIKPSNRIDTKNCKFF
jgi:hypothetical protein